MSNMAVVSLLMLAILFALVPLLRRRYSTDQPHDNKTENTALYREQVVVFQQQLDAGEIDQQQYDELCAEQQRLLLADAEGLEPPVESGSLTGGWLLLVMALIVLPLLSFSMYQSLGSAPDVLITQLLEDRVSVRSQEESDALRTQLIEKIAARLQQEPEHVGYLVTQARLLTESGQLNKAVGHYRQALVLIPDDTAIMAEYAQAEYFAEGNQFTPNVENAMEKVLSGDPQNITVLGLQGIKAFGDEDYRQAIISWQGALRGMAPGSVQAMALQSGVARAYEKLGKPLPGITVAVSLSSELQAQPDQVLFIYAKEVQGTPMPLAISRLTVADLPAEVRLDDSMAMPGGKVMSSVEQIQLVARISGSGNAMSEAGDLEGRSTEITLKGAPQKVVLVIDQTIQ